ncbi:FMN-binding negative transcriptional regulator [Homoserinimonas sp. OAct 916]|uniref:FMN-binding negative transcriptional regulator n=1 Tax=Homoserinimonas sp. OAct 916 TaxID=2211450 RepID=UPI000DBEA80B|nr:FMN-binding negative transcriptional regulator [Homoserinimonas sp. OAct 916]
MRKNHHFSLDDPEAVKRLIRENPWATLVSTTSRGLVASHYPVLLDENREEISVVSHVGRPDEKIHELGRAEAILIIEGPNGYISPGWYDERPAVPTWNFVVAHLYGVPEVLSDRENLDVLARLVDHFEDPMPSPRRMDGTVENAAYAREIVGGTAGFRFTATRFTAKNKMSQNKDVATVVRVLQGLESTGPYRNALLAREMRRVHGLEAR